MNWYTHYIGDYLRDTMHLSWLEDLAYRRLLETYYATERPIPTDEQQVFNICRTRSMGEQDAVRTVLAQFFELTDSGYKQQRVEKILAKSKYISEKRSKAGAWERNKKETSVEQVLNVCSTIPLPQPLDKEPIAEPFFNRQELCLMISRECQLSGKHIIETIENQLLSFSLGIPVKVASETMIAAVKRYKELGGSKVFLWLAEGGWSRPESTWGIAGKSKEEPVKMVSAWEQTKKILENG